MKTRQNLFRKGKQPLEERLEGVEVVAEGASKMDRLWINLAWP